MEPATGSLGIVGTDGERSVNEDSCDCCRPIRCNCCDWQFIETFETEACPHCGSEEF